VSKYVIGIDVGISLLSAENLRTGNVWQWFMRNPEPDHALDMVGLVSRRPAIENPSDEPHNAALISADTGKPTHTGSRGISH
jgi:hypothetical protein